jgi:hypothetical protein
MRKKNLKKKQVSLHIAIVKRLYTVYKSMFLCVKKKHQLVIITNSIERLSVKGGLFLFNIFNAIFIN